MTTFAKQHEELINFLAQLDCEMIDVCQADFRNQSPNIKPVERESLIGMLHGKRVETYAELQQRRGMMGDAIFAALHEYREWMKDDDYDADKILGRVIAYLERAEPCIDATPPQSDQHSELAEALRDLEAACDGVAKTRSHETYLRMVDVDGATDALLELDRRRHNAREIISALRNRGRG